MPIPTTNVGLSSIQTEFTGANPISISEYYAGGGGGTVGSYAHSNTNINWAVVGTRYGSFTL